MKGISNMGSHKITNLFMDYTSGTDATNKDYVDNLMHHSQVQPSYQKNEFDYLMTNVLEWTDLITGGTSFNITKNADLSASKTIFFG